MEWTGEGTRSGAGSLCSLRPRAALTTLPGCLRSRERKGRKESWKHRPGPHTQKSNPISPTRREGQEGPRKGCEPITAPQGGEAAPVALPGLLSMDRCSQQVAGVSRDPGLSYHSADSSEGGGLAGLIGPKEPFSLVLLFCKHGRSGRSHRGSRGETQASLTQKQGGSDPVKEASAQPHSLPRRSREVRISECR